MKGLILAAGVGSRLRPMTNNKPKCLVKVCGKPILEYQLDAYYKAGIKDIIIVVGYEGQAIYDYCKHIKKLNITIVSNDDYETTNNMYSVYLARNYLKGFPFILNNADLAIEDSIIHALVSHESENSVAVDLGCYNDESMKVIVEDNKIISISKKISKNESTGVSIDFYKFSSEGSSIFYKQIEDYIKNRKDLNSWTEVALNELMQNSDIIFNPMSINNKKWVEIDNYEDLQKADRLFSLFDNDFATNINTLFLDIDGTIVIGNKIIDGVDKALLKFAKTKSIYFITNNSSKSKIEYVNTLKSYGIIINKDQVIISTDGVLDFLKDRGVMDVYVLGTQSLKDCFEENGIKSDSIKPEYVIVGYDTELTYSKLKLACKYINNGVDYIATHCDVVCPSVDGPIPDIGAIIKMLELTTQVSPLKVFGKPNVEMLKTFCTKNNIDLDSSVIVGDRLYTDIKLAKNLDVKSLLVLSGETSRDMIDIVKDKKDLPDYIIGKLSDI